MTHKAAVTELHPPTCEGCFHSVVGVYCLAFQEELMRNEAPDCDAYEEEYPEGGRVNGDEESPGGPAAQARVLDLQPLLSRQLRESGG